jgi:hypothetical protein
MLRPSTSLAEPCTVNPTAVVQMTAMPSASAAMRTATMGAALTRMAAMGTAATMKAVLMRMAATGTAPIRRARPAAASIQKAVMQTEIWPGGSRLRYDSPGRRMRG